MPRTWPYVLAVGVVGALSGAAIAGRPETRDPFVIDPAQIPTTTVELPDATTTVASSEIVGTDVPTSASADISHGVAWSVGVDAL